MLKTTYTIISYFIRFDKISEILQPAQTYTFKAELISEQTRARLLELGIGKSLDPLEALSTYLENRDDLQELIPDMLAAAENLSKEAQLY